MVWLNFGKSLLYTRFFLATLVRGPKDFTMFLQKVGGEESPWLPSTVSVTKVPEPVEGPLPLRAGPPRNAPLKAFVVGLNFERAICKICTYHF